MAENFVQKILDKLFGNKDEADSLRLLDGVLERSESFENAFEQWSASSKADDIIGKISNIFWNVRREIGFSPGLFVYSSPQANGFYFNSKLEISHLGFEFLLDEFRDRVLKMDYSLYTSDRKYVEVPAGIQRIDKHYLKPNPKAHPDGLFNQNYGNVLLELYSLNEKAQYLKCMVTVYSDHTFAEARPFEIFAECLFTNG